MSHRAASLNIEKLRKAGIIREVTGRRRGRIYVADEIVRTIEAQKPAAGPGSKE